MSHQNFALAAGRRELVGKKARQLRKQGLAPAVLYGYRVEPTNLQLDVKAFEAVYKDAGRTALVDLSIENGRPVRVFVQEVQRHPISQSLQHVDFHAVNLRQEITSEVPVVLVGEAPAVHNNVGVLLRGLETVTVHALPTELPQHVEVSIENLAEVDDAIHVSDIRVDGNYQITTEPAELIVKVTAPQLEPEVEEAPAEEAAEPEEGADTDAAGDGASS
jgi:large subunit ribosomal protein L25